MILHRMPSLGISSLDSGRLRVAIFCRGRTSNAQRTEMGKLFCRGLTFRDIKFESVSLTQMGQPSQSAVARATRERKIPST